MELGFVCGKFKDGSSMVSSWSRCISFARRNDKLIGLSKGSKWNKVRVLACLGLELGDASRT
jgi:hypothetical protein